ncbi:MAG: VIT1/CCC1 transporter family protein [Candidatus Margulisbacteria bacterium]|nr:VIT1/CCC1 transporter family protein [Candidatus Margulisiibacteriota bacterium]
MSKTDLSPKDIAKLEIFQKNEISEHIIYQRLAELEKTEQNRLIVNKISADELRHYSVYKSYTGKEIAPNRFKIWWYLFLAKIFGITFSVKLMENGEKGAQAAYKKLIGVVPEIEKIINDENGHENELVKLIDEEKLKYMGAVVLGMNDALVELTGTLAGLTFALQNEKLVGVAGLVTGVAAALSMAASQYLSTKVGIETISPIKAAIYTGITYIVVVVFLVLPFLLLGNPFLAMSLTLLAVVILIYLFNYYYSVVKEVPFRRRFTEMLAISLGVAFLSFLIGLVIRQFLGINV